ncbi:hypothetical protein C1645_839713 [Glomus cerebriforme]|uniref:Uncharacterized protein n=1 Tax=Glomus cerebriforme TaxID=658196 RepID=A0A397S7C4_9GLOM|nr:hypothetical protein C1645_839713 [Glomus cerebriforme]
MDNNKYHVGLKFGIVEVYYSAGKLEPLETTDFPELYEIPSGEVSIIEAAHLQSARSVSGGGKCISRCHDGHSYQNKNQN